MLDLLVLTRVHGELTEEIYSNYPDEIYDHKDPNEDYDQMHELSINGEIKSKNYWAR